MRPLRECMPQSSGIWRHEHLPRPDNPVIERIIAAVSSDPAHLPNVIIPLSNFIQTSCGNYNQR
jgi:hypothetical protein